MKKIIQNIMSELKKISNIHINIKWVVAFIIVLLIVLYYCKEQVLFEDLLKMLVPFLIGTSVKIASQVFGNLIS